MLCENPWLFGMKEGVKFTTKYIEEVKKLIDSAEKKNAGWYAACIYNMYGSHDEALNSIINTNTLEVYNIFDSACNFPDDNTDGIYQKLITDYQNKFAAYGEGASLYMPEKSTRLQLIKAALLLKRMKEYDATELKESLIESLIAKLDLTAEYSLSADVKEISFGSFYKGDNVAAEDITITNTSAYSVTLMEEATIYFDSTNVNGKVLQPGETVVISVKPRTGSWTDGYYEEKLTLYCKEEPEAGLKVNLCMMLKDKQAENVQLAEKAPIEIGSNQILKIKNNQCILVEGDGKETVQEDIKELLYCGVILKGGKLQVYNDVYIRELEYIKGSIEGFDNANVTIDKLITQNGSGDLYFKGATYRVYSDTTIKRNINTTSETTVVFEKNLETSEISIGNGDFEIYGKTTGRIKMGSGDFICRGDYEGGITMGTGTVRICGTFQQSQLLAMHSENAELYVEKNWNAYTVQTDSVQTGYELRYYMNGERIDSPIESGIYDVQIIRPEDDTYKKVDVQITGGLVIKKADVQVITQPTVKDIKTGDALQNAIIDINSDAQVVSAENEKLPVYGIFEWEEPDTVVGASGDYYAVFQPVNGNYNSCRILLSVIASSEMHKLSMSNAMEHGRLQFSADEALPEEQITVTVVPETGYHWTQELDKVTVIYNGKQLKNLEYVGENQFRIEMPASDTSIKVEMQLNTYSVTKECDTEQGKLEGPEQVQHGETATYRAVPEEGYLIKDILVNGKSVYTGSDTVTVPEIQADIQISVTFEKKKVIFTYGTYEHGSITAYADDRKVLDGDILEYGTILTLEILPEEGYEIKELRKFQSSMREVLNFIKYSKDKRKLAQIMQADAERFKHMEREAVQLLNLVTGAEMEMDEEKEVVNMCKAIQDMRKEERELGQQEGRTQMIQSMLAHGYTLDEVMEVVGSDEDNVEEGKETGTVCKALEDMRKEERKLGQQEGEQKGKQQVIRNMLLHNYAIADIMTLVECKEDEVIEVQKSME